MIDLAADRHGHAIDYAGDQDRRYFREHPDATRYLRAPIEHEFCIEAPDGPCYSLAGHLIEVVTMGPGSRVRIPVRL
jgi:hypothetical protein